MTDIGPPFPPPLASSQRDPEAGPTETPALPPPHWEADIVAADGGTDFL